MKEIKLTTEVALPPSDWKINHRSKILTLGSCFAEVLGRQLKEYKFQVSGQSLGTIFNPLTICKTIDMALEGRKPSSELFFGNQDGIWLHHDFHSSIYSHSKAELEAELDEKLAEMRSFLRKADLLVITLGTAYAYRHKATNQLIGNCHKLPADKFVRELLHPDQINPALEQLVQKLLMFKRDLRIVLTVSPVRHTKDTLPLNQVSKSILRLVCHRLTEKYKHVGYFPSYEIMLDELRDYRFYKEDLIHPSPLAEEYIFDKFAKTYLDTDSQKFVAEWDSIRQAINHRPLHGATGSQYKHLMSTRKRIQMLPADIDFSQELKLIDQRLAEFPR